MNQVVTYLRIYLQPIIEWLGLSLYVQYWPSVRYNAFVCCTCVPHVSCTYTLHVVCVCPVCCVCASHMICMYYMCDSISHVSPTFHMHSHTRTCICWGSHMSHTFHFALLYYGMYKASCASTYAFCIKHSLRYTQYMIPQEPPPHRPRRTFMYMHM